MTTQSEVSRLQAALLSAALEYHEADRGGFGDRGWWGVQLGIRADLYARAVRRAAAHDTIPAPGPDVAEEGVGR